MQTTTLRRWRFFPRAEPTRQPTPWWYYGRALYVSRRDYFMIYCALMLFLGFPFVFLGLYFRWQFWNAVALGAGTVSLFYLGYSLLLGMYRMYGHPGKHYVRRLLDEAGVHGPLVVADLHIGTYRHSYILADLLPEAIIHSVDCWTVEGEPKEAAIRDVRDLECPPTHHPRLHATRVDASADENTGFTVPLADASCDAVVFGFGTHEIPDDGARSRLFAEAKRILKPGGKALMFEHGNDFHNVIIFGPVIGHVTARAQWMDTFKAYFANIGYARTSHAVDLFWGAKAEPTGTVCRPLPRTTGRRDSIGNWLVVAVFSLISLGVVAYLPPARLLALYWGIAILGLVWPWLMIGVALAGDWLARRRVGT